MKSKTTKNLVAIVALAGAGVGIYYAIKKGLFGGNNSGNNGGGNGSPIVYVDKNGTTQSSNDWITALINAGSQLSSDIINVVTEATKNKQGKNELKAAFQAEYGYMPSDRVLGLYTQFIQQNGRKPSAYEVTLMEDADF